VSCVHKRGTEGTVSDTSPFLSIVLLHNRYCSITDSSNSMVVNRDTLIGNDDTWVLPLHPNCLALSKRSSTLNTTSSPITSSPQCIPTKELGDIVSHRSSIVPLTPSLEDLTTHTLSSTNGSSTPCNTGYIPFPWILQFYSLSCRHHKTTVKVNSNKSKNNKKTPYTLDGWKRVHRELSWSPQLRGPDFAWKHVTEVECSSSWATVSSAIRSNTFWYYQQATTMLSSWIISWCEWLRDDSLSDSVFKVEQLLIYFP